MTEQETEIKRVISYIKSCREAGIDTTITIDKSRSHFILNALEEIQQFYALGTLEELREAREKQRAKKPIRVSDDRTDGCPICKREFYEKVNFCPNCGMAIDWSEEE